ncbi:hypothetical protein ACX80W_14720 [Arthrobacter sp. TMN-37]
MLVRTHAEVHAAVSRGDGGVLSDPADPSSLEGQLRLFSVHVEEAADTSSSGARRRRVVSYGVSAEE